MTNYDNTDRGVFFTPKDDGSQIVGTGHVSFGPDKKDLLIYEIRLSDGRKVYKVLQQIGTLWTNDDKKTENHPDQSGTVTVDKDEWYMSLWRKISKNNNVNFMSVSVSKKDEQKGTKSVAAAGGDAPPDKPLNDEVPF